MGTKKYYTGILVCTLLMSTSAHAGSFFVPKEPDQNPTPISTPQPTPSATPTADQPPVSSSGDLFADLATVVGQKVDSYFQSYRDLIPVRRSQQSHTTDKCDANVVDHDRFIDRITYYVDQHMQGIQPEIGSIASYYGISANPKDYFPVSLISHAMCSVTAQTLAATIKNVPSQAVIDKANEFAKRYNQYRTQALQGDQDGTAQIVQLWSKLMSCLAYTESLTTADTSSSDRVASQVAPSDYRKPAGVLFYQDPSQSDPASRLNIGLYQFAPYSTGNINSCIRTWDKMYPQCSFSSQTPSPELIRILGSSYQSFNAFCGADKIIQTFSIQANTKTTSATHPSNKLSNGQLKAPQDRCVSLHFQAGKAYNHFGPFQNSTGSNLNELLTCVLKP